jgi:hypothetical protein
MGRRIEYENTAPGSKKLEKDLKETIKSILQPSVVSLKISEIGKRKLEEL